MRRDVRYQIAALVSFWWSYQGELPNEGHGVTYDISQNGVWILTDAIPHVGARIQLTINLPRLEGSRRSARLEGEGIVVRCKKWGAANDNEGPLGFGASVQLHAEGFDDADLLTDQSDMAPAPTYTN